jgi:tyrosinase
MHPARTVNVTRHPHKPAGLPTDQQITSLYENTNLDFLQFAGLLESYHDTVHVWVGGTMANIHISPADPLFWMHHAQVDRIWSLWQAIPANAGKTPALTGADLILDPWQPDTVATVANAAALNYSYA